MNFQRNIVLRLLRLLAGGLQLRLRHVVRGPDFQQCGQGLCELGTTGRQVTPTLVNDRICSRNRAACDRAETTRIDLYQLRVGQVYEGAVISYGGKVCAFRNFFGVLLLLDLVSGDADVVIVLQRQLAWPRAS